MRRVISCRRCGGSGKTLVRCPKKPYLGMCLGCHGRGVEGLVAAQTVAEKIQQRRYQMLVHSFLYYQMGVTIVSDYIFDRWAMELVDLQRRFPIESSKARYYEHFRDFDGSTGFDLPFNLPDIQDKANKVLKLSNELTIVELGGM